MGTSAHFVWEVLTALQRNTGAYNDRVRSTVPTASATLSADDLALLAEIASGVTTTEAAERLDITSRDLRRRLRSICDQLGVDTPIEAVVWAARRKPRATATLANEPVLAPEQTRLLAELATGATLQTVSRRLNREPEDLRSDTREICNVLGVRTPIEAVVWAAARGLV
jgi:DNA-binding NarL/FixJ family response regulator|nr:hypothetical protein [Nocardiopsis trehalosi]